MKILKMIMSTGFGFMILSGAVMLVCMPSFPLGSACATLDMEMVKALIKAEFVPMLIGTTMTGSLIYVLTGNWKMN